MVPSSKAMVLEHGQTLNQNSTEDPQDLVLVQLSKLSLKDVEYLQYCTTLKICILVNNYITSIEPLFACTQLIKLDLHGNQIHLLPRQEFWSEMRELKLLYLHNNGIERLKNVQALSSCPNLIGLTLFDTPASLKKRYRHIVVNSILSLKVLDNYVISDEEIIEDCHLTDMFKPLNPRLFLHFLPVLKTETNFQDEIEAVKEIISKINYIHAHNSPVLIIQRMTRGYLTRKKMGRSSGHKKLKQRYCVFDGVTSMIEKHADLRADINRCAHNSAQREKKNQEENGITKTRHCTSPDNRIMYITVDLSKLCKEITQVEQSEKAVTDIPNTIFRDQQQPVCSLLSKPPREENKQSMRLSKSWQKEPSNEPHLEDKGKTKFRLSGFKSMLHKADSTTKIQILHKEAADDIRHADSLFHLLAQQKPRVLHSRQNSSEKKVSSKTYSYVKFAAFYAIDKAYTARQRNEIQQEQMHKVFHIQSANKEAKVNVKGFLLEKRSEALRQREIDGLKLQNAVLQLQLRNSQHIENMKGRYIQSLEQKKHKQVDNKFVQVFRTKHTSMTKTLLNHDREVFREDTAMEKKRHLEGLRQQQEEQRLLIKDLKEYRLSLLQRGNAADRAELEAKISRKANDRLLQARAHVAAAKANQNSNHAIIEAMQKIPVDQTVYKEAYIKYFSD